MPSKRELRQAPATGCQIEAQITGHPLSRIEGKRTEIQPADRLGRRNDVFPSLKIVLIPLGDIVESQQQIRTASKKHVLAVKRSMERFGARLPILVRGKNADGHHEAIDGHSRIAAARLLAAEEMPCIVVEDLPDREIRRLALSLNKLQEGGDWDPEALRLELGDLVALDADFDFPGFEVPEIEALLLADDGTACDPADDIPRFDTDEGPVSRRGDLWILGEHRVFCGSARDDAAVIGLLPDEPLDAVWTDPPYNVRINGHVRQRSSGFAEFAEASGEMSPTSFVDFLAETLGNAADHLKPGGILFACMDWRHVAEMSEAIARIGLTLLNICVWVKDHPGQGSLYRSQHELVHVARKPGAKSRNNVELGIHGRNRSNVWTYAGATGGRADGDDDFAAHPTVKPIRLIRDALLDVTLPGELVFDPFLGSGSTLLASERTRRRCVGIDIDPTYVDVTVRRWQEMTGGEAIHTESGKSFNAVADMRRTEQGAGFGRATPEPDRQEILSPGSRGAV